MTGRWGERVEIPHGLVAPHFEGEPIMDDRIVRVLTRSAAATLRVLIVQRPDGAYAHYQQWASPKGWTGDGASGVYDTGELPPSPSHLPISYPVFYSLANAPD